MAMISEGEIDGFVQAQVPANTRKKTESDVGIFRRWLALSKPEENREIFNISPIELNTVLRSFYLTVRKRDGGEYEPDTISSFMSSLDRYLLENNYKVSIIRGEEFKTSRSVLQAKRKYLKKEGLGRKPNRADHLTEEEEKVLWDKGIMGKSNPVSLQNAIWWRNNFFGIRGRDEHHKMRWGDITIESDVEGRRFLKYQERDTKTRQDPSNERAITPKIYETPESPETCPVLLLLEYTHRRPQKMVTADSPFYIQPNKCYGTSSTNIWYKCQRLGEHSLSAIMRKMSEEGGLPGRKTNHSGRKTTVKRLREAEVDNLDIMQLTGHKNVQSINNYSSVTEKKQREMSNILSHTSSSNQIVPSCSSDNEFSEDFDLEAVLKSMAQYQSPADPSPTNITPATCITVPQTGQQPSHNQTSNLTSPAYQNVTSPNMMPNVQDFNLTAQNSLGFAAPLFQSANISGGSFNITINFNGKHF